MSMQDGYRICSRCVMDTSDPEISFDERGHCNHCTQTLKRFERYLPPLSERQDALQGLLRRIRDEGKKGDYDCVIGVSGGVDSTSVAFLVRELGLRALAVHLDNGWNSELAVDNISRTLDELGIELVTHVVDWDEFRDLQLAHLRASVANAEAPTDHAITALLFQTAREVGTRFILSGGNLVTEAIMPWAWGHAPQDLRLMKALNRRFGSIPLKTLPTAGIARMSYRILVRRIRQIPLLNYFDYDKEAWKKRLADEIGWRDYGGKHYESVWTRFFQGHYLPVKFGYDKRRAHLSSLICAGQVSRDEALLELSEPPYPTEEMLRDDLEYVLKKLGLSQHEFDVMLAAAPRKPTDYPNSDRIFRFIERRKDQVRKIAAEA